jgi:CubicO group peptidase (beta-lactamase class C family)
VVNRSNVSLLLLFVFLAGCGGKTKFVSTWKNPEAKPASWDNEKVAAFAMTFIKASRLGAEDALAQELTRRGTQGIAGYKIVPQEMEKDKEKAKQLLVQAGIKGAVMMRVVDRRQETYQSTGSLQWVGSYYPSFWGYWGYGWGAVYQPGHMTTDTVVSIETLVYSVDQDQLLWAGVSSSTNPKNVPEFIKELCDAAGREIRKAGLVTQ